MMEKSLLDILFKNLQDREIAADREGLREAFDGDHRAEIEAWITEYLSVDTLLTKDELSLYLAIQKSGDLDAFQEFQDLSSVRDSRDEDFQIAIEDLRQSNATIEKQTESLRIQQDAISSLVKINRKDYETRSVINNTQHKAWVTEYRTLSNQVEETLQSLRFQVNDLESQRKVADASLKNTAAELVKSDDKLLLSLQKLASDLEPGQPKEDESTQLIRELCARLIKYTVEGVRSRLDKVYLEATNSISGSSNGNFAEDAEVNALREELESLYSEILPVAQMSAEQLYLQPALRALSAQDVYGKNRSERAITYMSDCLIYLISRLENFTARAEEYQSHRLATTLVLATARMELDTLQPSSPTKGKASDSPGRRKNSKNRSKPTSPMRPRFARRRSSVTSLEDDTPAEQQLLRNLGISLPGAVISEKGVAIAMADALDDRMAKLALHEKSVQEGSEAAIASQVFDSWLTLKSLRESLLSETAYKTVRLTDREVEEAVNHVEAEVEDVKKAMVAVDLEKLKEKNVKRDELVRRW